MNLPTFVRAHAEGVMISIKLQPRASRNQIGGAIGGELKIAVTAPPVDSAANEALVELLAGALDCPRGAVQIIRGQTSRHKTVLVRGLTVTEVAARLEEAS